MSQQPADGNMNRSRGDLFLGDLKITRPAVLSRLVHGEKEPARMAAQSASEPQTDAEPAPEGAQNLAVQPARAPLPAAMPPQPAPIQPASVRYVTSMPTESHPEHMASSSPALSVSGAGLTLSLGGVGRRSKVRGAADAVHYSNGSFWMGLIYLAVGIGCLVVSVPDPVLNCGLGGSPPLRDWVFGTGISYTIIGGAFLISWLLLKNSQLRPVYDLHSQPQCKRLFSCFYFSHFSLLSCAFSNIGARVFGRHVHLGLDDCRFCQSMERWRRLQLSELSAVADGTRCSYFVHRACLGRHSRSRHSAQRRSCRFASQRAWASRCVVNK